MYNAYALIPQWSKCVHVSAFNVDDVSELSTVRVCLCVQVVAGLTRTIEVQIVATAAEGSSSVYDILEIITEGNIMKLPISACIL